MKLRFRFLINTRLFYRGFITLLTTLLFLTTKGAIVREIKLNQLINHSIYFIGRNYYVIRAEDVTFEFIVHYDANLLWWIVECCRERVNNREMQPQFFKLTTELSFVKLHESSGKLRYENARLTCKST